MTTRKNIADRAKALGQKGRKKAVETAAAAEAMYRQKGLHGTVGRVLEEMADATVSGIETIVETGRGLHAKVQEQGGYEAAVRDRAGKLSASVDAAFDRLADRMQARYEAIERDFMTGGKYDPVKIKGAAAQHGRKAAEYLEDMVRRQAAGLKAEYQGARSQFPARDELRMRYAGIGTLYDGVLFRQHYEECLAFEQAARSKLPSGLKTRDAILADIKASASGSADDLASWYAEHPSRNPASKTRAMTKLEAVKAYLAPPAQDVTPAAQE